MIEKYKGVFIAVGGGLFIGLQMSNEVPGFTDSPVSQAMLFKLLGIGAVVGFIVGLINLSEPNPNPYKKSAFFAFFIGGLIALLINLYRGFVDSDFGFNVIAVTAISYLPFMLIGGAAALAFSKKL